MLLVARLSAVGSLTNAVRVPVVQSHNASHRNLTPNSLAAAHSLPHLLHSLPHTPSQQLFFCLPGAEAAVAANDWALFRQIMGPSCSEGQLQAYIQQLQQPGVAG